MIPLFKSLAEMLTRREPEHDVDSEFACAKCDDTGWVPCRCGGDICVCDNHGEKRCSCGRAES